MRRAHAMPFGCELLADGRCRFRLWAPSAASVTLQLDGRLEPMTAGTEGWYERITQARVGAAYCFVIDDELCVADPASRAQQDDVHGPSLVIDPGTWQWGDAQWRGRPWHEVVLYELHVGTFSAEGNFEGVRRRLDHLVELGVTAVELMPVADFPGRWNWGYDGVLPFAPDRRYGTPEELKALVEAAHRKGLMVFLDVVYNHFGPEGNYLHQYAEAFFSRHHHTPWGAAINFDEEGGRWVRQFFIHNALYWLEEYHLDGLRLDAVHAIEDDSAPDILQELAGRVRTSVEPGRHVHLVLENDGNEARYLRPRGDYDAQWNDDLHHVLHVLTTDEETGYYADYRDDPLQQLGRCLVEGFAYQGEPSSYRQGAPRGESTAGLAPGAFVNFLQNHDQVGNRAFGERITELAEEPALRAATALLLLAPSPPLLFMGQEWGTRAPFPFFCDFGADLAPKVTEGRRQEFARFPAFSDPKVRARIPDPVADSTYEQARLEWGELEQQSHRQWLALHRELLALRRRLLPHLARAGRLGSGYHRFGETGISVHWPLDDGRAWQVVGNLGPEPMADIQLPAGEIVFALPGSTEQWAGVLPAWSVVFILRQAGEGPGGEPALRT